MSITVPACLGNPSPIVTAFSIDRGKNSSKSLTITPDALSSALTKKSSNQLVDLISKEPYFFSDSKKFKLNATTLQKIERLEKHIDTQIKKHEKWQDTAMQVAKVALGAIATGVVLSAVLYATPLAFAATTCFIGILLLTAELGIKISGLFLTLALLPKEMYAVNASPLVWSVKSSIALFEKIYTAKIVKITSLTNATIAAIALPVAAGVGLTYLLSKRKLHYFQCMKDLLKSLKQQPENQIFAQQQIEKYNHLQDQINKNALTVVFSLGYMYFKHRQVFKTAILDGDTLTAKAQMVWDKFDLDEVTLKGLMQKLRSDNELEVNKARKSLRFVMDETNLRHAWYTLGRSSNATGKIYDSRALPQYPLLEEIWKCNFDDPGYLELIDLFLEHCKNNGVSTTIVAPTDDYIIPDRERARTYYSGSKPAGYFSIWGIMRNIIDNAFSKQSVKAIEILKKHGFTPTLVSCTRSVLECDDSSSLFLWLASASL